MKRSSPHSKAKLRELLQPPPPTALNVMLLLPNQHIDYGQLVDIREQRIGEGCLPSFPDTSAGAVRLPPSSSSSASGPVSLADWWEHASFGRCRWSAEERQSVRVAVVRLHRPDIFALLPADLVWRAEAFVPWEEEQERREKERKREENGMSDLAAASSSVPSPSLLPSLRPRSVSTLHSFSVRDGFVSSPGYVLLSVDYSNIELRMMAHFTADHTLVGLFKENSQIDTHTDR
jgi:hypothetical protein